jgi:hypothetical protein
MADAPGPRYSDEELRRIWEEFTRNARLPDWILEMTAHYYRTGTIRSVDLHRLLGDQSRPLIASAEAVRRALLGEGEKNGG